MVSNAPGDVDHTFHRHGVQLLVKEIDVVTVIVCIEHGILKTISRQVNHKPHRQEVIRIVSYRWVREKPSMQMQTVQLRKQRLN